MSPINTDFYDRIIGISDQNLLKSRIEPLWLGGDAGPSGGQGLRPGGFLGQLIQRMVAYDTTEAATLLGSGTLVDNLNHIRYRVQVIEQGGAGGGSQLLTIARWNVPSGVSALDLPDIAYEVYNLSYNGLTSDPLTYTLSDDGATIVMDTPTTIDTILTAQYSVRVENG